MGRRIPRGAGWRLVAVMTLLIAMVGMFPIGARAASAIAIAVTDDAGAPLAGAAFGAYAASVDLDGTLFIDPAALIGGPVVTGTEGLASLAELPDGLTVGVRQLVIPHGYLADAAGDRFITNDPAVDQSLAVVNAVANVAPPVTDQSGVVTVAVTEQTSAVALGGVAIAVRVLDPTTGTAAGEAVAATVSDPAGAAELTLPVGSYVVSVAPPGGYLPADAQPVAVGPPAGGVPAETTVAFGLQPDPTEPTEPTGTAVPTDPPSPEPTATETAVPTVVPTDVPPTETPGPTATTEPTGPTATVIPDDPSAAPSASATASASSDGSGFVPNQPASVLVRAIVCVSNEPELIGAMRIRPDDEYVALDAELPPDCRPAGPGEFTFVFRDPRQSSPWDDQPLGQRPTDANGVASFPTVITRDGQELFVIEQANQNDFSDPFRLLPNDTVSLLAVKVIGEPKGDVAVRPVDSVSGAPVAGTCYDLAAAGVPDVPLASACDADDDTDGVVSFPGVANGAYVAVPSTTAPGYVFAPATPLTVASGPVDLPLSVAPYGTLQLLARSCLSVPAGVTIPTPTPATGDGIDGLDGAAIESLPAAGSGAPVVVFGVLDGSAIDAAGTGLEGDPTTSDCTRIGASLTVTAPDGTATAIAVGQDGVAVPASLPPATGDQRYTVRDDASGAERTVAVNPAGTTTVTMVILAGGPGGGT